MMGQMERQVPYQLLLGGIKQLQEKFSLKLLQESRWAEPPQVE